MNRPRHPDEMPGLFGAGNEPCIYLALFILLPSEFYRGEAGFSFEIAGED